MLAAPHHCPGVAELAIGASADHEADLIAYYRAFGFRPVAEGRLDRAAATALYRVASGLRSVRLCHRGGYGAIRISMWNQPHGPGLGLTGFRTLGNRWATIRSDDILAIANHAADASAAGLPIYTVAPQRNLVSTAPTQPGRPFVFPVPCIHEMVLVQPLTREMVFQRHQYQGADELDLEAPLRGSGLLHFALVVRDSEVATRFYCDALGWQVLAPESEQRDPGNHRLYDMAPDETLWVTTLAPSGANPATTTHLHILRFAGADLPSSLQVARPGALGPALYYQRVADIEAVHAAITRAGGTGLTSISADEFGDPCFTFTAPDGYVWAVVEGARRAHAPSGDDGA